MTDIMASVDPAGKSMLLDSEMSLAEVEVILSEHRKPSSSVSASQVLAAQRNAPLNHRTLRKNWSEEEDLALKKGVSTCGERNWKAVAEIVKSRNHTQCMQRWSKALKPGLKKGHWTNTEDDILREMAQTYDKNWAKVVLHIPGRTVKQIRERWSNHVNPIINHSSFTEEEDKTLVEMHEKVGNKWALIAKSLNSRTAEGVKIRWKSLCRKSKQELKRRDQQRQHKARMQQHHARQHTDGYVSPPSASSYTEGCSPPFGPSSTASKQPPSLLRLSRHILVGLDTTDAGLARAPGSPMPKASPPKKARTFSYENDSHSHSHSHSQPTNLVRQGRSHSVDSISFAPHSFPLHRTSSLPEPASYRDPSTSLSELMGDDDDDDDDQQQQRDDFQLPLPLSLTLKPGLQRARTEPAPSKRSYSASLSGSGSGTSDSDSRKHQEMAAIREKYGLYSTNPSLHHANVVNNTFDMVTGSYRRVSGPSSNLQSQSQSLSQSHSLSQNVTEVEVDVDVQQAEADAEAEAELGELLGELEEIEAQQAEQERVRMHEHTNMNRHLSSSSSSASSSAPSPFATPMPMPMPRTHPNGNNSNTFSKPASLTSQLQTGLKSCPSLKLTDSLKNLFLSDVDMQVLDEVGGVRVPGLDDSDSDDDENEDVTVMVSESDVVNSHRDRNNRSSSSTSTSTSTSISSNGRHIAGTGTGIARKNNRNNSNSTSSKHATSSSSSPSRPSLLIRPPSFNRVLSNLTNSPLASQTQAQTQTLHLLPRSLSNKSLLGVLGETELQCECGSPTVQDFELLSEHLQDCEFDTTSCFVGGDSSSSGSGSGSSGVSGSSGDMGMAAEPQQKPTVSI